MALRVSDLDSDLDSIRKSCDAFTNTPRYFLGTSSSRNEKNKIISIVIIKQGADDKGEDK